MFHAVVLLACLALSSSHAVLPIVAPVAHSVHVPLAPLPLHGFGHGLGHGVGLGLAHGYGHGFGYGHHILKRSPHLVAPIAHGHLSHVGHVAPLAHVAPIAHVAPVAAIAPVAAAVSHQSRVDVRTSPAVVAPVLPVVKPVIAPVVAAPLLHKSIVGAPFHGLGHYAAGHGHYGLGHLGHY